MSFAIMEHNNITQAQILQAHSAAFKPRGITVKAYCLQHGIKRSNNYYRQNKLQPQPAGKCIPITPAPVSIIFIKGTSICFENLPPVDY